MPYSAKQCRLFGAMASGNAKGTPPDDWKKHCKKGNRADKVLGRKKK